MILNLIHALAQYEKLGRTMTATPERLRETLFGIKPAAEVILRIGKGNVRALPSSSLPIPRFWLSQVSIWKTFM